MRLVWKHGKLKKEAVERFAEKLMLQEKYKNYWYPEKPLKGQPMDAFVSISFRDLILTSWKPVRTATFCTVPGLVRGPHFVGGPREVGRKKNAVIVASFENEDRTRMRSLRKLPGPLIRLSLIISQDPLLQMKKRGSRGEIQFSDYNPSPIYQILELIFPPLPM